MKRTLSVALLLPLFFFACSPKQQNDCGFVQNAKGERLSWKGKVPIVLELHESVPKVYEESIKSAVNTWNRNLGKTVLVLDPTVRTRGPIEARKDHRNVIYFYPSWEADRSSEQARTLIYWQGDLIEEADIRINASQFRFYATDSKTEAPSGAVNIEALLLHEMGHVLGLKHTSENSGSVMSAYLSSNTERLQPSSGDLKSLSCEY